MTLATKVTLARICLVPVFAAYAIAYSQNLQECAPRETYRHIAILVFTIAAASDALDGWIARRFHQQSALGAYLDPIADKFLVLTAVLLLTFFHWGFDDWRIPIWFAVLVILRECVILGGIRILYSARRKVPISPHWTGKICTLSLFIVLGWVMLKIIPISPQYPCLLASIFILWSMLKYIQTGIAILRSNPTDSHVAR